MKKVLGQNEFAQLKTKIENILSRLDLVSARPIEQTIRDKTKDSFSEIVTDKHGQRFFLKIRLLETPPESAKFTKLYQIHKQINKINNSLKFLTAKMISSNIDGKNDYLLFEYLEGQSMGSRSLHDVIKLGNTDIDQISKINKAVFEFDYKPIKDFIPIAGFDFYKYLLYEDAGFDRQKLIKYFSAEEIGKIESFANNKILKELIDKSEKVFAHGDFQPPNFYRSTDKLMLVDFDSALLAYPLYDIVYLYKHSYRKPDFQKKIIEAFVSEKVKTQEDKYLFTFVQFCLTFVWIKVFLNKKDLYKKQKISDLANRKRIFDLRLADVKKNLKLFVGTK